MPFTGQLGSNDAQLGDVQLGFDGERLLEQFVEDSIVFSESASVGDNILVFDTFTFDEDVSNSVEHVNSASDSLTFVERASFTDVSESLTFSESTTNLVERSRTVSQTLTFDQDAFARGTIRRTVHQQLTLSQTASLGAGSTQTKIVTDTIAFVEAATVPQLRTVLDTLTFVERASFTDIGQSLVFVEMAIVAKGQPVGDELEFTDTATREGSLYHRTVSDSFTFKEAAIWYVERPGTEHLYSPFLGVGTGEYPQIPATLDCPLPSQERFRLVYPATGTVTDSLILRAPNLGNRDRLSFNRINRETRGGTLVVFADPTWPKVQTLALTFSGLKVGEARALLTFIKAHLGRQIGIIDWEGYYWQGVIVTYEPIIEDSRNSFTAAFEFEGERATWTEQELPEPSECTPPPTPNRTRRPAVAVCCPTLDTAVTSTSSFSLATTDDALIVGNPIYIKSTAHIGLALATAATWNVAGLATADKSASLTAEYLSEGKVSRDDWTPITGSAMLLPGFTYFLDPTTPGRLTHLAPTTTGHYVVPVGVAQTHKTLDIEIGQAVKL